MQTQLIKGMYGQEFHQTGNNLFNLRCGQCRCDDFVHNGGWYNKAGEKLGWGDLSPQDLLKVSNGLEEGELFVILPESASFWNFVTRPGIIGSLCVVNPDVEAPGTEYVAEYAMYIISRHQLYLVDRYRHRKEDVVDLKGLEFKVLTKEGAKQLIAS